MWDVIVVGGGAAGLWAAGTAAARHRRVLVLEKNRKAGVKILMSGGTRCNITHACDITGIVSAFGNQGRFLKPSLHGLSPDDVIREVEKWGVPTKREDTGKIFPVSDRAIDVRDALVHRLTAAGAELRTGISVLDVSQSASGLWQVHTAEGLFEASKVMLATGGLSYPGCGTTGDGYAWACKAGHTIEPTFPALTPLLSPVRWVHELQGVTLNDVSVSVVGADGRLSRDPRHSSRGGFLWTHFGCSGPAAMNVSRAIAEALRPQDVMLQLDLVPWMNEGDCERLLHPASTGAKSVFAALQAYHPRRMVETLLWLADVPPATNLAELKKESRRRLVNHLKRLRVPMAGTRGYAKAEVTAGGVRRQEVDPRSMRSRMAEGLYLIGEILDVDGPIGGYNFQAAFSTGHAAGLDV